MLSVLKGLLNLGVVLIRASIEIPRNKLRTWYIEYRVNRAIKLAKRK